MLKIRGDNLFVNHILLDKEHAKHFVRDMREVGLDKYLVVLASGTAKSSILRALGMHETKKELIYCITYDEGRQKIKKLAIDKYHFDKKQGGVYYCCDTNYKKGDEMEAVVLHVIVDRGTADDVVETLEKNGGTGATVIHGRGSGIEKRTAFFDFVIEPEKDIVLVVTTEEKKQGMIDALNDEFGFEKKNTGVIFSLPVVDAVGFNFDR